jgi:hypothetical protein
LYLESYLSRYNWCMLRKWHEACRLPWQSIFKKPNWTVIVHLPMSVSPWPF